MKRRTVLAGAGAVGVAGCIALSAMYDDLLGGTGDVDTPEQGTDEPGEHLPFDVWTEIRRALRTSPDHLPGRAAALVADGDPEAIFEFVRDDVVTLPIGYYYMGTLRDVRWGTRGTLRGGAGTPREKADLLASLYEQAGFEATVLSGRSGFDEAAVKRSLFRPPDRRFDPAITTEQLADWNDRMGLSDPVDLTVFDADGTASAELAASIEASLPPKSERLPRFEFDWRWGTIPIVGVDVDGQMRYANLFDPDVPFGEAGSPPEYLQPAPDVTPTEDVTVTLSTANVRTSEDQKDPERMDLVTGTWPVEDLVGRQVLVSTLPGVDPLDRPDVRFADVRSFVPALSVQGVDLDPAEAMSVVGDAVTRRGSRLAVEADGTVTRDGRPLVGPEGTNAAAAATVATASVSADPSQFGELTLEVTPRDGAGDPVEGLGADDFEVYDEGAPVGVSVESNRAAPRVLVLVDRSGSMPSAYYTGEAVADLRERLTGAIIDEYPGATVTLQQTTSDLWSELARGAATDANLLVYATDGHVNDSLTPEIEATLRAGPPAVMLSVYDDTGLETLQQMADLTGGVLEPASEHAAAEAAILGYLADMDDFTPYVVSYAAPIAPGVSGPAERQVTVRFPAAGVEGSTRYEVPQARPLPPLLCGLYLSITMGNRTVTRTLAGFDPLQHEEVTDELIQETAGALFGTAVLAVEGEAPGHAVWFDDFLAAKSSVAAIDRALISGNQERIQAAREAGVTSLPPEVMQALAPLHEPVTAESLTFAVTPRMALYHEHPVFGADYIRKRIDIPQLTRFATVADDPDRAFATTLEKTARLAVYERDAYDVSTASLLAGTPLAEYDAHHQTFEYDRQFRWRDFVRATQPSGRDYQLMPADGETYTYWNVDHQTGSLLGILPDGSGGGSTAEGIRRQLEEFDRVISMINLLAQGVQKAGALTGPGGLALGVVAAYGQLLARLYGAAALAITIMDASGLEAAIARALGDFACEVSKNLFYEAMGMEVWPGIENLIGAMGGSSPVSCG